jgi:hypothetical protein
LWNKSRCMEANHIVRGTSENSMWTNSKAIADSQYRTLSIQVGCRVVWFSKHERKKATVNLRSQIKSSDRRAPGAILEDCDKAAAH